MTHADRDRSEPVWLSAANAAHQQATQPNERAQRYAEAMDVHSYHAAADFWKRYVQQVMAVADAEIAEAREELAGELKARLDRYERALADERAKVDRVEAYIEGVDPAATVQRLQEGFIWDEVARDFADGLRAALAGDA